MIEIIKASPAENSSAVVAAAAKQGLAMETDPTVTGGKTARPATPTGTFLGFLTREVSATDPSLADLTFPGRTELATKAGNEAGIEGAMIVEVEGTDFVVDSGTGLISAGTSAPQNLSFIAGKFRIAQTGDNVYFRMTAQVAPKEGGAFRIRAERV